MNSDQLVLTIVYSALVLASVVGVIYLISSTRPRRAGEVDHQLLAGIENRWAVVVVVLLVILLALTITSVPYGQTSEQGAQRVNVQAQQFGWAIQPASVRAGRPVEFRLVSKDVQHGFGVFDGHKLLFQVQVPARGEHVQQLVHTFHKKGTYNVLCMEFCGFQHHMMRGVLRVT